MADPRPPMRPLLPARAGALALALLFHLCPSAPADAADFDSRLHGVALVDFGTPLADALDAWLRAHPPGGLVAVHRVVLGPVSPAPSNSAEAPLGAAGTDPLSCAPAVWRFDVLGTRVARHAKHAGVRHRQRPGHEKPGVSPHVPATDVVRVAMALPDPMSRCPFPEAPEVEVEETFSMAELDPFLRVSTSDQVVLLEDPARDFRRIWPAGVGAIDTIRAPGHTTSLTPVTDGSRIHPASAFKTLGAPSWFANEPFIPLEAPMAVGQRVGYYTTRLAFHIYQTYRFIRGYVSRGCVTLRTGDLRELRDALFVRETAIPLLIQAEALPGVFHPHPHEDGLHFRLKPFGDPERPTFRVSGNLYVTEKVTGPPPAPEALIGVYLDSETKLRARTSVADERAPSQDETRTRL